MEKRECRRIPVDLDVEFRCRNMLSHGKITDVSESGMFVRTEEICFPSDWQLEMTINKSENPIYLIGDIKRLTMNPKTSNGFGVQLVSPPDEYVSFVRSLKAKA